MSPSERQERLNQLMEGWRENHTAKGYRRFILDGAVCPEVWWSQKTPRVCFFLKEAYTEEASGYDLTAGLHENGPWKMWKKAAVWTQAIHNAFSQPAAYNPNRIREREGELIDSIAIVNVKKSEGSNTSSYNDLEKYVLEDKGKLKQQLELLQPQVILCGNTIGLLKIVLGGELNNENTWADKIAFWKDALVIDYYHPACQYPNAVNYYALSAICRTAIENRGFSLPTGKESFR